MAFCSSRVPPSWTLVAAEILQRARRFRPAWSEQTLIESGRLMRRSERWPVLLRPSGAFIPPPPL